MQLTVMRERACGGGTRRNALAKHACTSSITYQHRAQTHPGQHHHPGIMQKPGIPAQPRCSSQTRASGHAGAERAKAPRGARAARPATSQHRVGRWQRGSDERRRGARTPCFFNLSLKKTILRCLMCSEHGEKLRRSYLFVRGETVSSLLITQPTARSRTAL
jgi:hypothetical protein